jgi:hypothetical protein
MRARPESDWLISPAPDLRIIPDDLWNAAQARSDYQRRSAKGNLKGRRPKYVLSGLLECAECGSHYVITKGRYYGCAAHANRGPDVCANGRLVARDRLERIVVDAIFEKIFSAETLVYLSAKVNEALANTPMPGNELRAKRLAELADARLKLNNIKSAIEQGVVTRTTREMLAETEERIARLEVMVQAPAQKSRIAYLPDVVEACLRDLKGTLETDPDHGRALVAKLIGTITLRRKDDRLWAEMQGNLAGLLEVDEQVGNGGAGSPSLTLAHIVEDDISIA